MFLGVMLEILAKFRRATRGSVIVGGIVRSFPGTSGGFGGISGSIARTGFTNSTSYKPEFQPEE